jgi:hypothetical protein
VLNVELEPCAAVYRGAHTSFYSIVVSRSSDTLFGRNTRINGNFRPDLRGGLATGSNVNVWSDLTVTTVGCDAIVGTVMVNSLLVIEVVSGFPRTVSYRAEGEADYHTDDSPPLFEQAWARR